MSEPILKVSGISGGYRREETIVTNVSFTVKNGEFIGIIGPNGSGKTTLLRLISRILPLQKGSMVLEGCNIARMPLKEFCKAVSFVAQETLIPFSFSVNEMALLGRTPHLKRLQAESKKDIAIVEAALRMTDTFDLKEKAVNELSAGERQRVMLAKALSQEPKLLLLDEPTAHLDIGHQIQILDLLKKLNRTNNLTVMMVVHDLNLASEYCGRILLLDKGALIKDGKPEEVLTYQNIERVYKTVVVVEKNPINNKPYVVLVSGER